MKSIFIWDRSDLSLWGICFVLNFLFIGALTWKVRPTVAWLRNRIQKLIQQQPSRTLISITYFGCRNLGSKSFAGEMMSLFLVQILFLSNNFLITIALCKPFNFLLLFIPVSWSVPSCRQVDRDCDFLEQERIMDYSLLVGLHFRKASYNESLTPPRTSGVWTPSGIRTHTGLRTPTGLQSPTGISCHM